MGSEAQPAADLNLNSKKRGFNLMALGFELWFAG
jgi:hypothetical protein